MDWHRIPCTVRLIEKLELTFDEATGDVIVQPDTLWAKHLAPEIADWLAENATGQYRVGANPPQGIFAAWVEDIFHEALGWVEFENARDAMLYKLTHGGDQ